MGTEELSLCVCVIGQNVAPRLGPLLSQASAIASEIVFVDGGSQDQTADVVGRYPNVRLVHRPFDGNFAKQKNFALAQSRSAWNLVLDTDELLGPNFLCLLPALLRSRFHGFHIPRYWLAQETPPLYVCSEKHYPDRQHRLFRNRPELRYDENRPVHEAIPRESRGPCLSLKSAHLLHYCFLWEDREARAGKVARYLQANPSPINQVYLYEEFPHRLRPCREAIVSGRPVGGSALACGFDRARLWLKNPAQAAPVLK